MTKKENSQIDLRKSRSKEKLDERIASSYC